MAKIQFYAKKAKGQAGYTLLNSANAIELIAPLSGTLLITVETIEADATDAQLYHFRYVVVPTLVNAAMKSNERMTEADAELLLLSKFGNGQTLEQIAANGKKQVSDLIDESKQFLREFFNINI